MPKSFWNLFVLAIAMFATRAYADRTLTRAWGDHPDRYCPKIKITCAARDVVADEKHCGSGTTACASVDRCEMTLTNEMCHLFGFQSAKPPISGAEFRTKTDCTSIDTKRVFKHGLKQFISECAVVRHEYGHLMDHPRKKVLHPCSEVFANDHELFARKAMFKKFCPDSVSGANKQACIEACSEEAYNASNLAWDSCVCSKLNEHYFQVAGAKGATLTQSDCGACVRQCEIGNRWKNYYPDFCKVYNSDQQLPISRESDCMTFPIEGSGHSCSYFGGPAMKESDVAPYGLSDSEQFIGNDGKSHVPKPLAPPTTRPLTRPLPVPSRPSRASSPRDLPSSASEEP